MAIQLHEKTFAALFKKYRLRSEIDTLSEFGDLLTQEGLTYETSLFTRWQNGERVPHDRRVILAIIRLFTKLGGIKDIREANAFFEAVDQRVCQMKRYMNCITINRSIAMQKIIQS